MKEKLNNEEIELLYEIFTTFLELGEIEDKKIKEINNLYKKITTKQ